jgi:hypothetical protein
VKSGYVVKGGTVRGYWNTAKRIAVQNRYRTGTDPVQIRYKSGTEVGHVQGEAGGEKLGPVAPLSHRRDCLSRG